jgi:hypothetical protein
VVHIPVIGIQADLPNCLPTLELALLRSLQLSDVTLPQDKPDRHQHPESEILVRSTATVRVQMKKPHAASDEMRRTGADDIFGKDQIGILRIAKSPFDRSRHRKDRT